jgi:serine/threonine-protein kinase
MLNPGTILQKRYQIIQPIDSGGMADVYLASDSRLGSRVVVKENRGGESRQFEQEAQVLANLSHPNLPHVIDHFIDPNGSQYLVMDYIAGENLEKIVQARGALAERDALVWLDQIFNAVEYLHANGIIHRDIKPANIIITPTGKAVLVDLGIAKRIGQGTQPGARGVGSPGFASPEHYTGGTDVRSDIYALGATVCFVLTAQVPVESLHRLAGTPLIPLRHSLRAPLIVAPVIYKAMELKPGARFQSIGEFQAALQPHQLLIAWLKLFFARFRAARVPAWSVAALILVVCMLCVCFLVAVSQIQSSHNALQTQTVVLTRAQQTATVQAGNLVNAQGTLIAQTAAISDLQRNATVQAGNLANAQGTMLAQTATISDLQRNATAQAGNLTNAQRTVSAQTVTISDLQRGATVQAGAIAELQRTATAQALAVPTIAAYQLDFWGIAIRATPVTLNRNEGTIAHGTGLAIPYISAESPSRNNIQLKNLIMEAEFFNPYDRARKHWDYGFFFRSVGNDAYWLIVSSEKAEWELKVSIRGQYTLLANGTLNNFDLAADGNNFMRLIVEENNAFLFINQKHIASITLPATAELLGRGTGTLGLTTGYYGQSHQISDRLTRYARLAVWSLPDRK